MVKRFVVFTKEADKDLDSWGLFLQKLELDEVILEDIEVEGE